MASVGVMLFCKPSRKQNLYCQIPLVAEQVPILFPRSKAKRSPAHFHYSMSP